MSNLIAAALTDRGMQRENNEDRVWAQVYNPSEGETVGLFIVCDGVGGHLGGECASHWAIETVKHSLADYFCPKDPRATVNATAAVTSVGNTDANEEKRGDDLRKQVTRMILSLQITGAMFFIKNQGFKIRSGLLQAALRFWIVVYAWITS